MLTLGARSPPKLSIVRTRYSLLSLSSRFTRAFKIHWRRSLRPRSSKSCPRATSNGTACWKMCSMTSRAFRALRGSREIHSTQRRSRLPPILLAPVLTLAQRISQCKILTFIAAISWSTSRTHSLAPMIRLLAKGTIHSSMMTRSTPRLISTM